MNTKNAIVEYITIDIERGLTVWVGLDYGGLHQGFGGWLLYSDKQWQDGDRGPNYAGWFIHNLCKVLGVTDLDKGVGKSVRAIMSGDGWDAKVVGLMHILKDDITLEPNEEFNKVKGEAA